MKVSLITATYNSESVIRSCLESVAGQTYEHVEHIVVDGKSTDTTVEIVKEFTVSHPYVTWTSESDQGIYDALNKGIEMASGEVIGFVHSDDLLANRDILQEIMDQFRDSDVSGVYGDLKYVDASDTDRTIRYWRSSAFSKSLLHKGWMPPHPTLFLKKELYTKYGRFNTNLKIAADYEFVLRLFQHKDLKFYYLPQVITLMRLGGASNRNLQNIINKSREDLRALRMNNISFPLWVLIQKNISKLPQWLRK